MEIALNIFWLLLAVASLVAWTRLAGTATGRRQRHQSQRRLLTLCYTLVLLFPVISMTDDLHGEEAALEEPPAAKALLKAVNDGTHASHPGKFQSPLALATDPASVAHCECFGWYVVDPSFLPPRTVSIEHPLGRAPPSR